MGGGGGGVFSRIFDPLDIFGTHAKAEKKQEAAIQSEKDKTLAAQTALDKNIAAQDAETKRIGIVNLMASGPQGVLDPAKTGKAKLLGN